MPAEDRSVRGNTIKPKEVGSENHPAEIWATTVHGVDGFEPQDASTAGPRDYVSAATWDETGITLTHDDTTISGESGKLVDSLDDRADGPSMPDSFNNTGKFGLTFDIAVTAASLTFESYYDADVYIEDLSDGSLVWNGTATGGATTTANVELSPGSYRIYKDGSTSANDNQRYLDSATFPYSGEEIEITGRYVDGSTASPDYWNFLYLEIDRPALSGTLTVEYDHPVAIKTWERLAFLADDAGETIEIDAKLYDSDTGTWEVVETNVSDGYDLSSYDPDQLGFDIRFSRTDTANDPTVEYVAAAFSL